MAETGQLNSLPVLMNAVNLFGGQSGCETGQLDLQHVGSRSSACGLMLDRRQFDRLDADLANIVSTH